jgi:hypothetical protein
MAFSGSSNAYQGGGGKNSKYKGPTPGKFIVYRAWASPPLPLIKYNKIYGQCPTKPLRASDLIYQRYSLKPRHNIFGCSYYIKYDPGCNFDFNSQYTQLMSLFMYYLYIYLYVFIFVQSHILGHSMNTSATSVGVY